MACSGCERRRRAMAHRIRSWIRLDEEPIAVIPVCNLYRIGDVVDGYEVTRIVQRGRGWTVYGRRV